MSSLSLQALLDLFNAEKFSECFSHCSEQINTGNADPSIIFIAASSAFRLGDFISAQSLLSKLEGSDNEQVTSLAAGVNQSLEEIKQLPDVFFDENWMKDKDILRIGGRVRLLDFYFNRSGNVTDLNAATETHGRNNAADIVADAHVLDGVDDESMDVIASSHTIEHLVNPMLALSNWIKSLKPGGYIYSVVPNYVHTFDHKRTPTTLEHLVEEMHSGDTSINWFHIVEFLRNHDCDKDYVFRGDKKKHFEDFMQAPHFHTHYHVFDLPLVYAMHEYVGYKTVACFESEISVHYVGIKPDQGLM